MPAVTQVTRAGNSEDSTGFPFQNAVEDWLSPAALQTVLFSIPWILTVG